MSITHAGEVAELQQERAQLRKLVVDLSDSLHDEGQGWSIAGLDKLRRQVATLIPADQLSDFFAADRPASP